MEYMRAGERSRGQIRRPERTTGNVQNLVGGPRSAIDRSNRVRRLFVRLLAVSAPGSAPLALPSPPAHASPVPIYPGMEIHQDTNLCTLGYVEPNLRIAVTAGDRPGMRGGTHRGGNQL